MTLWFSPTRLSVRRIGNGLCLRPDFNPSFSHHNRSSCRCHKISVATFTSRSATKRSLAITTGVLASSSRPVAMGTALGSKTAQLSRDPTWNADAVFARNLLSDQRSWWAERDCTIGLECRRMLLWICQFSRTRRRARMAKGRRKDKKYKKAKLGRTERVPSASQHQDKTCSYCDTVGHTE